MNKKRYRLLLASASAARRATLVAAGLRPEVMVSSVDEEAVLEKVLTCPGGATPAEQVLSLARAKARDVAHSLAAAVKASGSEIGLALEEETGREGQGEARTDGIKNVMENQEGTLVVGCDSMLEFHGEVLGKPHSPQLAQERVRALSGDSGVLHTGHWLVCMSRDGSVIGEVGETAATTVNFDQFSEAEVQAYVASGEPLEVAGSFTIDGLGGAFIRGIVGDPHNVVGISLPLLRRLAGRLGIFWPDLWG